MKIQLNPPNLNLKWW